MLKVVTFHVLRISFELCKSRMSKRSMNVNSHNRLGITFPDPNLVTLPLLRLRYDTEGGLAGASSMDDDASRAFLDSDYVSWTPRTDDLPAVVWYRSILNVKWWRLWR